MRQHLVLLTLAFAYLLTRALGSTHNEYDEGGWHYAGRYVAEFMNRTKQPCDEFYEHVCGNYGADGKGYDHNWFDHMELLRRIIVLSIKDIDRRDNATTPSERSVRTFFDQCMMGSDDVDHKKILNAAIISRVDAFGRFGDRGMDALSILAGETKFEPWRLLGRIKRETGAEHGFKIITDWLNVRKGASMFIWPTLIDIENTTRTYDRIREVERVRLAELSSLVPSIEWKSYFEELLPGDIQEQFMSNQSTILVDVYFPELLEEIGYVIGGMNSSAIKGEIYKAMQEQMAMDLGNFPYRPLAKERRCLYLSMNHLAPAIAKLYFKKIGVEIQEWRQDIINLARNIFSAFRFLLNNVDWLDALDKEKVQRKVDDILFHPGIPNWIDDEIKVTEDTEKYKYDPKMSIFENVFQFRKDEVEEDFRKMLLPEKEEAKPVFKPNAFYGRQNAIFVMLGVSTPPMYHINYPLAVKYGGLGYIIGHEMMHAFDARNVYIGPHPDKEWLKDSVWPEFEKRKNCLVKQYAKSCFPGKSVCVSGRRTVGENIADIDGLKVAYTAYKFSTQVFGDDPPIPDMLSYTQDQLFFLTTARVWCSRGWSDKWLDDVHTPDKPRVDIMMRNVPVFARAFRCTVGSEYAPLKVCSIWGDLANPARKL